MTLALFDQTLDMGADGNTLIVDAAQPHGFKFAPGGAGALTKIGQIVAAGSPAFVTFSSIPAGFSALRIIGYGQDTSNAVGDAQIRMRLNNDNVAANYTATQFASSTATVNGAGSQAATTQGCTIAPCPGTLTLGAGAQGIFDILLPGYAATVFNKVIQSECLEFYTTNITLYRFGFSWKSTAAINRIDLSAGITAFANGSTFNLYGVQ